MVLKPFRVTWAKRLPRKPPKAKVEKPGPKPKLQIESQLDHRRVARKRSLSPQANAPADWASAPTANQRKVAQGSTRAQRLAAGRTAGRLAVLMRSHLFSKPPSNAPGSLQPCGGLFATWADTPVFIISTFSRYRVPHADVIALRQAKDGSNVWNGRLSRSNTHTIKQDDLVDVGLHFRLLRKKTKLTACLCHLASN